MGKSLMDVAVDKLYQALGGDKLTGKLGEVLTSKRIKICPAIWEKRQDS